MWCIEDTILPIIIGATEIVKQGILEHIKKMPGNIKTDMIQTITLFGTAHILRKCVMDNS